MANTKITTAVIKDDAITTAKIADDAVTGALIADDVALAGNPTTTTQSAGNSTTRIATTAFVTTAINNLVDSAPSALDTLNELAAAMGDDANFSTTITNSIATKLPLAGGTMTGNIAHASDFTLDVGGDITLDAGGGDFVFADDGTTIGAIVNSSTNFVIKSAVSNSDLLLQGNDGGSIITALTLDMSEAGAATFNSNVGIGTAPSTFLHLETGTTTDILRFGAGGRWGFQRANSDSRYVSFSRAMNGTAQAVFTVDGDNGNVGIGASSPARALSTKSSSVTVANFESTSATAGLISFSDSNTTNDVTVRAGAVADNLVFQAGGSERGRFTSSGNFGIGIDPPNTFSVGASGTVATRYTSTDTGSFSLLQFGNDGSIVFSADHGNTASGSDIVFKADGAQERARIAANGNVGIKTSAMASYYASDLVIGAAAEGGITVVAPATDQNSYIMFADGTSGGNQLYAGYMGYLHNTDKLRMKSNGDFTVYGINAGADTLIVDNAGNITMPTQPAFLVKPVNQNNFGTSNSTVAFATEVYDQGGDFSSNTFTAPVTGKYQFSLALRLDQIPTDANYVEIKIVTSNRNYHWLIDPDGFDSSPNYFNGQVNVLADMDASDTATVQYNQSGGSSTTDIISESHFSGFLAC